LFFIYLYLFVIFNFCKGPSCLNKTCGQGTLNKDTNYCQCLPGWIGQDCLTCRTDEACKAVGKGKCDTSVVIDTSAAIPQKFFSCKVLGPLSVYLGDNVTWDCNTATKDCSFETWLNYEGKQQELFWCKFDNCTMNADSSNVVYACTKSFCACTDAMPCSDIIKKILAQVTGSGSLTCSLDKDSCSFKHMNFPFGTVPLQCSGGSCK